MQLQYVIVDWIRYMHAILTNRGEAMHKIQNRLRDVMGLGRKAWGEPNELKKVGQAFDPPSPTSHTDSV
jgi:hypothetical protein